MPASYPDFPHHSQIAAYFEEYVDHFGFRDQITFETGVEHAGRDADGVWTVELDSGETRRYDALLVANGHHWQPRWPEPAFPGSDTFTGVQMHAHSYVDNSIFAGKRVVVLGMGNSAMDIAVESSYVAESTYLAARQGVWIVPKYIFGKPVDQLRNDPRVPFKIRQRMTQQLISELLRAARALRAAEARPPLRRGAPDGLRAHPRPHPARHDRAEAEHRLARRLAACASSTAPAWRPTWSSTAPATRSPSRSSTRTSSRRPDNHIELFRRVFHPDIPERVLHRPAAAARRDHAAGGGAGRVGGRLPARRLRAALARASCAPTSRPTRRRCASATWPPSATRSRSTSTTTYTRSPRSAARAPSARAATATAHRRYADLLSPRPLPRALPDLQQDAARPRAGRSGGSARGGRAAHPRGSAGRRAAAAERAAACAYGARSRAEDDGFLSELVPGLRASADAGRLAEEIAFSAGRLLALALDPPGLYGEAACARGAATSSVPAGAASWSPTSARSTSPRTRTRSRGSAGAGCGPAHGALMGRGGRPPRLPELQDIPLGPRTSHDPARGNETLIAYLQWVARGGTAARATPARQARGAPPRRRRSWAIPAGPPNAASSACSSGSRSPASDARDATTCSSRSDDSGCTSCAPTRCTWRARAGSRPTTRPRPPPSACSGSATRSCSSVARPALAEAGRGAARGARPGSRQLGRPAARDARMPGGGLRRAGAGAGLGRARAVSGGGRRRATWRRGPRRPPGGAWRLGAGKKCRPHGAYSPVTSIVSHSRESRCHSASSSLRMRSA